MSWFSRLPRFQRICILILSILIAMVLCLDIAYYRAFNVNPRGMHLNCLTLKSPKIPADMEQVSAVYISDLEYGPFSDPDDTQKIFDEIYTLNPDFFFFGGDLFDWNDTPDDAAIDQMTTWLSAIQAPLGKFAVHGEQDVFNEERTRMVDSILHSAQIEVLKNQSIPIGNQTAAGIQLTALSIQPNLAEAFQSASPDLYTLLLTHYPDNLMEEDMPLHTVDYALAGNAHGTQITWPVIGGYREWEGSTRLNRAHTRNLNFDYHLSSGIGCIDVDARLNAPVEVVYILFEPV